MNDVKDLELELNEQKYSENSPHSQMEGSGEEIKNKINELSNDIDNIFLKFMDIEKYLEKKTCGIEYMEKVFDNTLQMIQLFKNDMYDDIKYKIKELRNAAMKIMKSSNCLERDNEDLLNKLVNSSIFEGKDLLKNNIESLREIFLLLPDEEEILQTIKEVKGSENDDNDKDYHLTVYSGKDTDTEIENSDDGVDKKDYDKETDTDSKIVKLKKTTWIMIIKVQMREIRTQT